MHTAYLSLGTNLGDKRDNLDKALQHIEKRIGTIVSQSAFHIYPPWGFTSDNDFLNAAIAVETTMTPLQLLRETQFIERNLGRTAKSVGGEYHDRLIDIDILLYDRLAMHDDALVIPHPLMTDRLFVMEPLCEIAPDYIHPLLQRSIKELLIALRQ